MSGYSSVGILLAVLGVVFILVPYELIRKVFRRMRSPVTTKVGGTVLLIGGIAIIVREIALL